jgi:hypothetical protein
MHNAMWPNSAVNRTLRVRRHKSVRSTCEAAIDIGVFKMDAGYIDKYRQIEIPGESLHLYLRLRHIRASVDVTNASVQSHTSLDFSGIAQIDGYKPLSEKYRTPYVALSSPVVFRINYLGYDEEHFRRGRIGIGKFEPDRISLDVSLPEIAISRLLEITKHYCDVSAQEKEIGRFRSDEFPDFRPDYFLRVHFEIDATCRNSEELLPFNVTYIATDLEPPIFI